MVDSGFSQTLIRKAVPSEEDLQVGIRLQYRGFGAAVPAVGGGRCPGSPVLAGMPELVRIAPVLFLLVPLNALCVIQNTIFTRQFRFARLSKVVFTSSLVSGLVAIGMALGRMRYLEPGGATGSGDGCTGHVAVGVERLAPSGGFRRGLSACDGLQKLPVAGDRSDFPFTTMFPSFSSGSSMLGMCWAFSTRRRNPRSCP